MAKSSAMPMDWETADRLDELEVRMPDILVIPSFTYPALPCVFSQRMHLAVCKNRSCRYSRKIPPSGVWWMGALQTG